MSDAYDAVIIREFQNFASDTVRLGLRERFGNRASFLMPDGTWHTPPNEGVQVDHGLLLPVGSIEAIAKAIGEYQGHTSHADTEAKVLREWLAVEQRRVDAALTR